MAMQEERIRPAPDKENPWILYILRCNDGSFYAGITNDLTRRLTQHRGTVARLVIREAEGRSGSSMVNRAQAARTR